MDEIKPVLELDLYLVRHAESEGNIETNNTEDLKDKNDPLLSARGLLQAEAVGEYMKDIPLDAVFSSPLRRAVMTAGKIAGNQNKPLELIPDLTEIWIDPEYDGVGTQGLKEYYNDVSLAEGIDPSLGFLRHDGEDEALMFERAARFLDYIRARYNSGEKVAAVSHAGLLTYIIFYIIGYRDKQPDYDFRLSNTGITRILFFKKGTNRYGDIIFDCVNERKHISDYLQ